MNFFLGNLRLVYLFIAIIFSLFSCQEKSNITEGRLVTTVYDSKDRIIKQVYVIKEDTTHVRIIRFYENGNKMEDFFEKNHLIHGKYSSYYLNGKLKESGNWIKGRKLGFYNYYDSLGHLEYTREYLSIDPQEVGYYLNRVYKFSPTGDTIKSQSTYFSLSGPDTIRFGEDYIINLFIDAPVFDMAGFVICNYDEDFEFPKSEICDTVQMQNLFGSYQTKNYKRGGNVIRGVIFNYYEYIDSLGEGKTRGHEFYFTKEYYVK